jgi:hypothetical protein
LLFDTSENKTRACVYGSSNECLWPIKTDRYKRTCADLPYVSSFKVLNSATCPTITGYIRIPLYTDITPSLLQST